MLFQDEAEPFRGGGIFLASEQEKMDLCTERKPGKIHSEKVGMARRMEIPEYGCGIPVFLFEWHDRRVVDEMFIRNRLYVEEFSGSSRIIGAYIHEGEDIPSEFIAVGPNSAKQIVYGSFDRGDVPFPPDDFSYVDAISKNSIYLVASPCVECLYRAFIILGQAIRMKISIFR